MEQIRRRVAAIGEHVKSSVHGARARGRPAAANAGENVPRAPMPQCRTWRSHAPCLGVVCPDQRIGGLSVSVRGPGNLPLRLCYNEYCAARARCSHTRAPLMTAAARAARAAPRTRSALPRARALHGTGSTAALPCIGAYMCNA